MMNIENHNLTQETLNKAIEHMETFPDKSSGKIFLCSPKNKDFWKRHFENIGANNVEVKTFKAMSRKEKHRQ